MEEVYLSIKILLCGISLIGLGLGGSDKLKSKKYMYVLIFSLIISIIFCIMIYIPTTEYTILKLVIYIVICTLFFIEGDKIFYVLQVLVYALLGIVIVTLVGIMLLYALIWYVSIEESNIKEVRTTYEIVSVNDSFSIRSGGSPFARYVYETEEYKYYYKLDDEEESFKLGSIPADRTKIKYIEEGETPHIDIIEGISGNTIKWREYELYVPRNSIKNEYVFDIK